MYRSTGGCSDVTLPPLFRATRSARTLAILPTTLPPDLKARLLMGRIPVFLPASNSGAGDHVEESTFCDFSVAIVFRRFAAPERAALRYSCIDLLLSCNSAVKLWIEYSESSVQTMDQISFLPLLILPILWLYQKHYCRELDHHEPFQELVLI